MSSVLKIDDLVLACASGRIMFANKLEVSGKSLQVVQQADAGTGTVLTFGS